MQDSVQIAESISSSSEQDSIGQNNIAKVIDEQLKVNFVSPNLINLSTTGWPHNFHKKFPGLFKENHSFFKDNFKR